MRAVEPFVRSLLNSERTRCDYEHEAIEALGMAADVRAVEPLVQALKIGDCIGRMLAGKALEKIGEPAVEPLIHALKDDNKDARREALLVLGEIGDPRAVEPLFEALKDQDVRCDAAEFLGKRGDERAAQTLLDCLFEHPYKFRKVNTNCYDVFGDYKNIILEASGFSETNGIGRYSFRYSFDESDAAINKLCTLCTPISSNILHHVAQKRDTVVTHSLDCGFSRDDRIYFEDQRNLAKQELKRRGNPPYDPSIYLDKEAWKL